MVLECAREILAHAPGYEFINVLSAQDSLAWPPTLSFAAAPGQSFVERGSSAWRGGRPTSRVIPPPTPVYVRYAAAWH
jgi:hypothetical protein